MKNTIVNFEFTCAEIEGRIQKLHRALTETDSAWNTALLFGKVSQYYYTGSMQEGVFALKRNGEYGYFVRKSFARAQMECKINPVFPMASYQDLIGFLGKNLGNVYLDKEVATLAILDRLEKTFQMDSPKPIAPISGMVRAVKSETELALMQESGRQHQILLDEVVPALMREGMTEVDFTGAIFQEMLRLGYQGIARFSMFQTEMVVGQLGFGENTIFPTSFDGPGGMKGMSAAVPIVGDRNRRLKKGDLVFVDIGYGYEGYHSDRTQVYLYGAKPTAEMENAHNRCLHLQRSAAAMLKPGAIPSKIFQETVGKLDKEFLVNFMGTGKELAKFLGHGIGLYIDEAPIITPSFHLPLQENMVIALEPKKSLPGIGIVGSEDTYIVTKNGGKCITGGEKEILVVEA